MTIRSSHVASAADNTDNNGGGTPSLNAPLKSTTAASSSSVWPGINKESDNAPMTTATTTMATRTFAASYNHFVIVLLAIAPISLLFSMLLIAMDSDSTAREKQVGLWTVAFHMVMVALILAMVLPRHYEVTLQGEGGVCGVVVVPYLPKVRWTFSHVHRCVVEEGPLLGSSSPLRPRIGFATDWNRRVVVIRRRSQGEWDLVVSPKDTQDFVRAIQEATTTVEENSSNDPNDANMSSHEEGEGGRAGGGVSV